MSELVKSVAVGLGAALFLAGSSWLALAQGPADPLPVTFTSEQAGLGRTTYNLTCSGCHGTSPPGVPSFMRTNVGDLFTFISLNMPADAPASLAPDTYAAIVAYFLQNSGYTAGAEPLPTDPEILTRMSLAQ